MFDYIGSIRSLAREHGLQSDMNPGGAEFIHPTDGRLQIPAMDDADDHKALLMWLIAAGLEKPTNQAELVDWFTLS